MAGDDLAPWEQPAPGRSASGRSRAVADQKKEEPYILPKDNELPELFRPEDRGVVLAADRTMPRPPAVPRLLESRGQFALGGAVVAALFGFAAAGAMFVAIAPEAGVIRLIFAGVGGLIALAGIVVLLAEMGRVSEYKSRTFFPALLVFGTAKQFEKVVGPGGMPALAAAPIKVSGRGLLSMVFDRAAHLSSPPEIVALMVDRGSGAEFVPVPWAAVHTIPRGDVVWYYAKSMSDYLLFHQLVPYAPQLAADKQTREEVFRALKVGKSLVKAAPKSAAMTGQTKAVKVDRDGNLVVDRDASGRQAAADAEAAKVEPARAERGKVEQGKTDPGLDATRMRDKLSTMQGPGMPPPPPAKPDSGRRPPVLAPNRQQTPSAPRVEKFRIADPGKPLGGSTNPDDYGDDKSH
ncbi:MAG: hypothetical protein IT462_01520 [Planctomycetes bacterium]|nr:hypothetical protein [Planctomycetota bacterium]